MTDQNSQFFAILTAVGEAKQANAAALGTPWTFAQMGVGDANGTDPIPSRTQTKLINERRRAPLNQVKVDPTNASVIIAEQIIPENVGGWWVRELALYDADGDMVAVANCAPTFKPLLSQGSGRTQVIRINLIVSSTSNIELKIDPSVVLATREYVDTSVIEALARLDFKHSVLVATTANIALSGIQTVDGVLLTADARVLVKDQVQAKDNGIYVVPASGAWKRAQDADVSIEVTPGLFVDIEKGTANGDSVWQLVTDAPIVLGTTPLAFEVVAGRTGIVAGTYRSLTVDKLGRVIAGTNPTTLAGAGITDAVSSNNDIAIAGKIADVGSARFINGNPTTTDGPPSVGYFSGIRAKYNGGKLGFDFVCSMTARESWGRQTNADGSGDWFRYWTSANFEPSSKISGNTCGEAGFAGGSKAVPYMKHSDGSVVVLQVDRPKDTALLSTNGWNKNPDTGEIKQWQEIAFDDLSSIKAINVAWQFQFPNQFINAQITLRKTTSAAACVQAYYLSPTKDGCIIHIEEWAGIVQGGLVAIIEARGN
jgi:phage-related tail fiber protein